VAGLARVGGAGQGPRQGAKHGGLAAQVQEAQGVIARVGHQEVAGGVEGQAHGGPEQARGPILEAGLAGDAGNALRRPPGAGSSPGEAVDGMGPPVGHIKPAIGAQGQAPGVLEGPRGGDGFAGAIRGEAPDEAMLGIRREDPGGAVGGQGGGGAQAGFGRAASLPAGDAGPPCEEGPARGAVQGHPLEAVPEGLGHDQVPAQGRHGARGGEEPVPGGAGLASPSAGHGPSADEGPQFRPGPRAAMTGGRPDGVILCLGQIKRAVQDQEASEVPPGRPVTQGAVQVVLGGIHGIPGPGHQDRAGLGRGPRDRDRNRLLLPHGWGTIAFAADQGRNGQEGEPKMHPNGGKALTACRPSRILRGRQTNGALT